MYCGNCGNKVNDSDKYCEYCGYRLEYQYKYEEKENIEKEFVTVYEKPTYISNVILLISVVIFVLSLLPIHLYYTILMTVIDVVAIVINIVLYRRRKDKNLFFSIILNCASLYTILGWIYYLLVI